MKRRGRDIERLVLAAVMVIATNGCAEEHRRQATIDSGQPEQDAGRQPSQTERDAWEGWKSDYVDVVCRKHYACGTWLDYNKCSNAGDEAADMAVCDAAAMFYIANRKELDECISKHPTDCSVTPAEACPVMTGDKEFETICQ